MCEHIITTLSTVNLYCESLHVFTVNPQHCLFPVCESPFTVILDYMFNLRVIDTRSIYTLDSSKFNLRVIDTRSIYTLDYSKFNNSNVNLYVRLQQVQLSTL